MRSLLIIAQAGSDSARKLQDAFRNQRPGEVSPFETTAQFIVVMLLVVAALFCVIKLTQRRSMPAAARNPRRFFSQMLRKLGAGPVDRIILQRAARHAGMEHPAMMLLGPELMEKYAGTWADRIAVPIIRENVRHRIERISRRAFASAN